MFISAGYYNMGFYDNWLAFRTSFKWQFEEVQFYLALCSSFRGCCLIVQFKIQICKGVQIVSTQFQLEFTGMFLHFQVSLIIIIIIIFGGVWMQHFKYINQE